MEITKCLKSLAYLTIVAAARKTALCIAWLMALASPLRIPRIKHRKHLRFKGAVAADIVLTMNTNTGPRIFDGTKAAKKLAAEALEDAAGLKAARRARKGKGGAP